MLPAWFLTGSMWRDCPQQGHSPALPIHPTLGTERIPTCAVQGQGGSHYAVVSLLYWQSVRCVGLAAHVQVKCILAAVCQ